MSNIYTCTKEFKELGRFIDRCYGRTRTCSSASNKETIDDSASTEKENGVSQQQNEVIVSLPVRKFKTLQAMKAKPEDIVDLTMTRDPPLALAIPSGILLYVFTADTILSDFNMSVHFVLLTVTCFFVGTNCAQNVYPDNGWRPMSIEKVLELQRDFIRTPNVHFAFENSPKPPTSVMDDFENKNFVKIIQTNEITKRPIENNEIVLSGKDRNEYQELIKIIHPPHKEIITLNDTNTSFNNEKQNQQLRKAKMIDDSNIAILLNNAIADRRKSNENREKVNERNVDIDATKNYEVKEKLEEDTQSASDQNLFYPKGFKHQIPKSPKVNTKNYLTANLLEILANYNIRTSDNLRNYDISLRQNSRNSHNSDFTFMHVPVKVPIRYNNANHLLVDPLLAVFLSNYGHYVPSLFGIHSGYNNLYGYLASNNIHNNKPFGSYKIFSDTDSFH